MVDIKDWKFLFLLFLFFGFSFFNSSSSSLCDGWFSSFLNWFSSLNERSSFDKDGIKLSWKLERIFHFLIDKKLKHDLINCMRLNVVVWDEEEDDGLLLVDNDDDWELIFIKSSFLSSWDELLFMMMIFFDFPLSTNIWEEEFDEFVVEELIDKGEWDDEFWWWSFEVEVEVLFRITSIFFWFWSVVVVVENWSRWWSKLWWWFSFFSFLSTIILKSTKTSQTINSNWKNREEYENEEIKKIKQYKNTTKKTKRNEGWNKRTAYIDFMLKFLFPF